MMTHSGRPTGSGKNRDRPGGEVQWRLGLGGILGRPPTSRLDLLLPLYDNMGDRLFFYRFLLVFPSHILPGFYTVPLLVSVFPLGRIGFPNPRPNRVKVIFRRRIHLKLTSCLDYG